jgi:hypothetical protein
MYKPWSLEITTTVMASQYTLLNLNLPYFEAQADRIIVQAIPARRLSRNSSEGGKSQIPPSFGLLAVSTCRCGRHRWTKVGAVAAMASQSRIRTVLTFGFTFVHERPIGTVIRINNDEDKKQTCTYLDLFNSKLVVLTKRSLIYCSFCKNALPST